MTRKLGIFFMLLLMLMLNFGACTSDGDEQTAWQPSEEEQEKMIGILMDIHFAEAAIQTQRYAKDTLSKDFIVIGDYYEEIFRIHNISPKQFEELFNYYSTNAQAFDDIYEEIISRLSKQETKLQALARNEKDTTDTKTNTTPKADDWKSRIPEKAKTINEEIGRDFFDAKKFRINKNKNRLQAPKAKQTPKAKKDSTSKK